MPCYISPYVLYNVYDLKWNFEEKIVRLFFFETIDRDCYQEKIIRGFIVDLDVEDRFCWFQQDGATAYVIPPEKGTQWPKN